MRDTRIVYSYDQTSRVITARKGQDHLEMPIGEFLDNEEVRDTLAVSGAIDLLRRAAAGAGKEGKMEAIEEAYDRVSNEGVDAFKPRKQERIRKADKIAALASLEGATISAVEEALEKLDKQAQHETLNSERVLSHLKTMKSGGLSLSA